MAETADAITLFALRKLNVKEAGETLDADESADGLIAINDILDSWSNERYMQTNLVKLTQTLSASDGSYTFGSGGDNSTRPQWIETAFIRDSNNYDLPLSIIDNEQYSNIFYKTNTNPYPRYLYYRAEYPLGVVELWPVPSVAYTLHMEVPAVHAAISAGSSSVDLAPGYIRALKWILATELAPEYKEASNAVLRKANEAIAWIKRVNKKDRPRMASPIGRYLNRGRNNGYINRITF